MKHNVSIRKQDMVSIFVKKVTFILLNQKIRRTNDAYEKE